VFLSHATHDVQQVVLVARQIQALGIDVYLAENDPRPGTSIAAKIDAALQTCHVVVVLITTSSVNSAYVQQEVGLARGYRKPILPIVAKNVEASRLGFLGELEYLELDLSDATEALAKMTAALQPLVVEQSSTREVAVTIAPEMPDLGTTILLVGLGLLLGYLIFAGGLGGAGSVTA
jgi:hypothetical protein